MDENDFDTNVKNFKAEIEQYNVNRKKTISNFNKKKSENTKELLLIVNKVLAEYSESKSISMIFQKKDLVIAKTELDITDEIIVIIDKNIKNFKVK